MVLPNHLTVLRIILTPVFVFFFLSRGEYYREISLLIFLIAAFTDWYDGWLARKFNHITKFGKIWDPIADKVLTAGAFLSLVFVGVLELWMILLILFRDFFITAFRSYADYKGHAIGTSFYAKCKTFIQMAFLYYVLLFFVLSESSLIGAGADSFFTLLLDKQAIYYSCLLVTIITVHSGYLYAADNRKVLFSLLKLKDDKKVKGR
jgi:CDP-diacylglycerol--glycerol-3-phosphate 3-phosphatidyltransferase